MAYGRGWGKPPFEVVQLWRRGFLLLLRSFLRLLLLPLRFVETLADARSGVVPLSGSHWTTVGRKRARRILRKGLLGLEVRGELLGFWFIKNGNMFRTCSICKSFEKYTCVSYVFVLSRVQSSRFGTAFDVYAQSDLNMICHALILRLLLDLMRVCMVSSVFWECIAESMVSVLDTVSGSLWVVLDFLWGLVGLSWGTWLTIFTRVEGTNPV
jgi:hypothetical protein